MLLFHKQRLQIIMDSVHDLYTSDIFMVYFEAWKLQFLFIIIAQKRPTGATLENVSFCFPWKKVSHAGWGWINNARSFIFEAIIRKRNKRIATVFCTDSLWCTISTDHTSAMFLLWSECEVCHVINNHRLQHNLFYSFLRIPYLNYFYVVLLL